MPPGLAICKTPLEQQISDMNKFFNTGLNKKPQEIILNATNKKFDAAEISTQPKRGAHALSLIYGDV